MRGGVKIVCSFERFLIEVGGYQSGCEVVGESGYNSSREVGGLDKVLRERVRGEKLGLGVMGLG